VFTISVTLFLLSAFVLVIENIGSALESTRTGVGITIYLKDDASQEQRDALTADLRTLPEVEDVKYIDAAQALEDFRKSLGDRAPLAEGLDQHNPLPASLEVKFKGESADPESYEGIVGKFNSNPAVEEIYFSRGLIGKLNDLMRVLRGGGAIATILLLVVTSFIIANTIRLALHAHRQEIEIMRLVGATDWHVRIPYLIEGFLHGIAGGVVALTLLYASYSVFNRMVGEIDLFRLSAPHLHFLSWPASLLVMLSGVVVGIVGSYVALKRIMHDQ
jgi:cell division transport system permease protein